MKKKKTEITLKNLLCSCGGNLHSIPDADVDSYPPTLDSKFFGCLRCGSQFWSEPEDYHLDDWGDVKEFREDQERRMRDSDQDHYYYQ